MDDDREYAIKLILVGDSGVGKTSILQGYMGKAFADDRASTVGVDFEMRRLFVHDRRVTLQIWDTGGQERFRSIASSYYRVADVCMIVFDATSADSFRNVGLWLGEVRHYAPDHVQLMICSNKVDRQQDRAVSYHDAKMFADESYLSYMELSAKTGLNVESAINTCVQMAIVCKDGQRLAREAAAAARHDASLLDVGALAHADRLACCHR